MSFREDASGSSSFVRLSDLTALRSGRVPNFPRGETPTVARAAAIAEGDVIVAARGELTETLPAPLSFIGAFVSVDLYLVRPDRRRLDPAFLVAFLELPSTQARLASGKQGTGLARLAKEALDTLPVPLPAMAKQQAIGALADATRRANELTRRIADAHAKLRQARVRSAFETLR